MIGVSSKGTAASEGASFDLASGQGWSNEKHLTGSDGNLRASSTTLLLEKDG